MGQMALNGLAEQMANCMLLVAETVRWHRFFNN
jgi:hypothetical protein